MYSSGMVMKLTRIAYDVAKKDIISGICDEVTLDRIESECQERVNVRNLGNIYTTT